MLVLSEMAAQDEKHARNMRDPYLLSPIRGQEKPGKPFFTFTDAGNTGAYYLMAPANEPVVRQSWGLLEEAKKSKSGSFSYGGDFKSVLCPCNLFVLNPRAGTRSSWSPEIAS